MSRMRITAKLRQNHCYRECVRLLDALGLDYSVHPPTGKGHPFIEVRDPGGGDPIRYHVATTPKTHSTGSKAVSNLRRKLEAARLVPRE